MSRRAAGGFTLMEVLLATSLLAAALVLAFGILRAAGATVARGEAMAERNERIRAVSAFLRERIGGAQGIAFGLDAGSGRTLRFSGNARAMWFVAEVPAYFDRGGPRLHVLQVRRDVGGQRLDVDFRRLQPGQVPAAMQSSEPLARGLVEVAFGYRTLAQDGRPGPWRETWDQPDALPPQVRVRIRDAQGPWPEMVVALARAGGDGR